MPRTCPDKLNVLLLGGGGREHAIGWKLRQSPRLGELWVESSANAGLKQIGQVCPESIDAKNLFHTQKWCDRQSIDMIVVGPEAPLVDGLAEKLASDHRVVFGPSMAAARLEGDKSYAKEVMRQGAVATADGKTFTDAEHARSHVTARDEPCVVKAAGLAAGKGVVVCNDATEAVAAIDMIMEDRTFGEAGNSIVIEERLEGQELSVLALVDGHTISVLDPAQDHKQVGEGDTGPNTGGMGAYCPTPLATREVMDLVHSEILVPTIDGLRRDGIVYRGVLYAGLMLTAAGPKVLEFNCRFGDPECQPLMMRFKGDLAHVLWATATGTLIDTSIEFDPRHACCVVVCSEGYPGPYPKGVPITGIEEAIETAGTDEQVEVFHAGTTIDEKGRLVTSGGRVLGVTAMAEDLQRAQELANRAASCIKFEGAFHRRDIGHRVMGPLSKLSGA